MPQMKLTQKQKEALKIVPFLLFIVFLWVTILPAVTSEEFKEFTLSLGVFAPIVVILFIVFSHIFTPIPGTPGIVLGLAVFGLAKTRVYSYIGGLISSAICFYISRLFGRSWVTKLAGKSTMKSIDDFAQTTGTKVLIIGRVFGGTLFDIISYATGLTNIPFKTYYIITVIGSLISNILWYSLFTDLDFSKRGAFASWFAATFIFYIIFGFLMRVYLKKKRKG